MLNHNPRIVTNGLVLCLDAANPKSYSGSGTNWKDLSGNGNYGTLINGVGYSADNKGTMVFDGVNDFVLTDFFPSESILGNKFTWSFWAKYTRFANNIGSHGNSTEPRFYTQLTSTNGRLRTAIGDTFYDSATLGTENLNKWLMISFVYNEGIVKTYVNANLKDERSGVSFIGTSSSPWTVGSGFNNSRFFEGQSSNHIIYNRALSEAEIRQNYNALRGRYGL